MRRSLGFRAVVGAGFCAHNANLEGGCCQRHIGLAVGGAPHNVEGGWSLQPGTPPWDHNPFVLVNYSPTICLNPCPLFQADGFLTDHGRSREETRWKAPIIASLIPRPRAGERRLASLLARPCSGPARASSRVSASSAGSPMRRPVRSSSHRRSAMG